MTVFNKGGDTVAKLSSTNPETVTLDGVGDILRIVPISSGSGCRVNNVPVTVGDVLYLRIPFDATTVEVTGTCNITRGTVS